MKKQLKVNFMLIIFFLSIFSFNMFAQADADNNSKAVNLLKKSSKIGSFIENKGQLKTDDYGYADEVLYYTNLPAIDIYFMKDKIIYNIKQRQEINGNTTETSTKKKTQTVSLRYDVAFAGSNQDVNVIPINELSGKRHFLYPDREIKNVKNYEKITYRNIYPKTDFVFFLKDNYLKYDIILHPGADLSKIQLSYSGIEDIKLKNNGSLKISTKLGELTESIPESYQETINEKSGSNIKEKTYLDCHYVLNNNTVSFMSENYDKTKTLVIDPSLYWTRYIAGKNVDQDEYVGEIKYGEFQNNPSGMNYRGGGIVEQEFNGKIYIAGTTESNTISYFGEEGFNLSLNPAMYVSCINPNTGNHESTLILSCSNTFSESITATDITYDSDGNIIVVGVTNSLDIPTNVNSYQPACNGLYDSFIMKFNPSLTTVLASTYYGGPGDDMAHSVAVDEDDYIYIVGETNSSTFIATPGTGQPSCNSCPTQPDAFIAKLDPNLQNRSWGSYYGGENKENGLDISILKFPTNNWYTALITGATTSSTISMPHCTDCILNDGTSSTFYDGFVAGFNQSDGSLTFADYVGGSNNDFCTGSVIWVPKSFFLCGYTESDDLLNGFTTYETSRTVYGGSGDAFLCHYDLSGPITNDLNKLIGVYLGGDELDIAYDIDIKHNNSVENAEFINMTGATKSRDFPLINSIQTQLNDSYSSSSTDYDAFIARYDDDVLVYSSYFGVDNDNFGVGITSSTFDSDIDVSVAGTTSGPMPENTNKAQVGNLYLSGEDVFVSTFLEKSMLPTYWGGSDKDVANDVSIDSDNNIYITGYTESSDYETTSGVIQESRGLNKDIIIAKLSGSGALHWSTLYGGIGSDRGNGIAVDERTKDIFVTGATKSSSLSQRENNNYYVEKDFIGKNFDGFVMRINPDGDVVRWFTYFGDNSSSWTVFNNVEDVSNDIDINDNNMIAITGYAGQDVTMKNAWEDTYYSTTVIPIRDIFVAKYHTSGTLMWSTYIGGEDKEEAYGVNINDDDEVAIVGKTDSYMYYTSSDNLPYEHEAFKSNYSGNTDIVFTIIDSNSCKYSTFYGWTYEDIGKDIISYKDGNDKNHWYFVGNTKSHTYGSYFAWPLSGSNAVFDQTLSGSQDGFVSEFSDESGTISRVWTAYVGGEDEDEANGIVMDENYQLYICGTTKSSSSVATSGAYDESQNGNNDAFIFKINYDGTIKRWGTYYGGYYDDDFKRIDLINRYYNSLSFDTEPVAIGNTFGNDAPDVSDVAIDEYGALKEAIIVRFSNDGTELRRQPVNDTDTEETCLKNDFTAINNIIIYPNPCTGILNIETKLNQDSDIKITISDMLGSILLCNSFEASIGKTNKSIDVSDFANGMYMITFNINGHIYSRKFIKK